MKGLLLGALAIAVAFLILAPIAMCLHGCGWDTWNKPVCPPSNPRCTNDDQPWMQGEFGPIDPNDPDRARMKRSDAGADVEAGR